MRPSVVFCDFQADSSTRTLPLFYFCSFDKILTCSEDSSLESNVREGLNGSSGEVVSGIVKDKGTIVTG